MNETKHTPTRFERKAHSVYCGAYRVAIAATGHDAARITLALNAHNDMLAAMRSLVDACGHDDVLEVGGVPIDKAYKNALVVIAKAEEGAE